jgi:hypothetical protein
VHRAEGRRRARPRPVSWRARGAIIALLGLTAAALLVFEYPFRHLEARAAADLLGVLTPALVATKAPIIWFGLGRPGAFGLEITPDCSSGLLLVPLCVLGMGLLVPRRLHTGRVATGLSGAAAMLVAGNMARIAIIAAAIRIAGLGPGYQVGHLIVGSVVSIVCIAASLAFLVWTIAAPRRRGGRALAARLR